MKELKEFTVERLEEIYRMATFAGGEELKALAKIALAAKKDETLNLPLDYQQGHKDGLEWAARTAEACNPLTSDWLYDEPEELAAAIRKGPEMPPLNHAEQDGWIKCSERMPLEPPSEGDEDYKQVEVLVTDGLMVATMECCSACPKCDGGFAPWVEFTSYGPIPPNDVTHWMPLPAPPKPEM